MNLLHLTGASVEVLPYLTPALPDVLVYFPILIRANGREFIVWAASLGGRNEQSHAEAYEVADQLVHGSDTVPFSYFD